MREPTKFFLSPEEMTRYEKIVSQLEERLRKSRETNGKLLAILDAGDQVAYAKDLWRQGWSNRRIAEKLGVTLSEARRMTIR